MDKLTEAVKTFYESYPYPSGMPEAGQGIEPAGLLRQVRQTPGSKPLRILEAGCGCGRGLIAMARHHPELQCKGIDINPVAIGLAAELADREGLENVHFSTADLLKPPTLEPPAEGYDLIYSFGVLHHLADPLAGLRNLNSLLAPEGGIACMIYGRFGREPLQRLLEVIEFTLDPALSNEQRLAPARLLAAVAEQSLFKGTPWEGTAQADEVEFADRCLHVYEQSFDIDGLWSLLEQAGMRFVNWLQPDDWSLARLIEEPAAVKMLAALDDVTQYKIVERLFHRPRLAFLTTKADETW